MTLDEVISYNRLFADMETKSGDLEVAEYYRDTAECLEELKKLRNQIAEYKRLLKEAVDGYNFIGHITKDYACPSAISCSACPMDEGKQCRVWEHADEAMRLIGG